jgi:MoaA/NifB/PqqE/SkfB family radical SAM enzyme
MTTTSVPAPRPAATVAGPKDIVWDITYACPLRCIHCYSESGRRPSRQLGHEEMLRVADALISLRPLAVVLAGGEPLVVKGLAEIIERIIRAGIEVHLYTSGWSVTPAAIENTLPLCSRVSVSVDAATSEVHDRIRGRAGSFHRAMDALALLNDASRRRRDRGQQPLCFGLDATIVRSSYHQLDRFCTAVAPRFSELQFISFGAAMPIGLASRAGFVDHEMLSDDSADELVRAETIARLQSLAPPSVRVSATDNRLLQYRPDLVARGLIPAMQVEPDGRVRAMAIYEGTVGDLLTEPATVLWERCVARFDDPFVVQTLSPVRTMRQWAEATRRLDYHFGTDDDRARIDRRPRYSALTPAPSAGFVSLR